MSTATLAASSPPQTAGVQHLNPVDRVMWSVHQSLRGMNYPGFKTQMLVWLSGRADVDRLRRGITRLSQTYPIVVSRLVATGEDEDAHAYWQLRPGATLGLEEIDLASDDRQAVLDSAAKLLSQPNDPKEADPISFHLLHRPDGRDVFLMQYNHMLMDNNATASLLGLIERLSDDGDSNGAPAAVPKRLVERRLRRVPLARRREAAEQAIHLQGRVLKGRAAVLGTGDEDAPREPDLKIATRALDPQQSAAVRDGIVRICGFPSLSMSILGSVLRAIGRLSPHHRDEGRKFVAGIGLDLAVRNGGGMVFQNLMSLVPISAAAEELDDRDELFRSLTGQMRDRLTSRMDVGILQLIKVFNARPRYLRWVMEFLLRYGTSLWYAYFGSLDDAGGEFCGAEIDDLFYVGPTWSPVGLTLLVNQYRGRLLFQATYDPELVTPALADEFLDWVVGDLPK